MFISSLQVDESVILNFAQNADCLMSDSFGSISTSTKFTSSNYQSGTWTPSFTNQSGISSITANTAIYQKIENIVDFSISISITTLGLSPSCDISIPISRSINGNFGNSNQLNATAISYNSLLTAVSTAPILQSNSGAQTFNMQLSLSIGSYIIRITGQYQI